MPLTKLTSFDDNIPVNNTPLPNNQDVPKELDVYCRFESDFLPPGKTLKDLTPEELKEVQDKYRFDPFKPGLYQTITGRVKGADII